MIDFQEEEPGRPFGIVVILILFVWSLLVAVWDRIRRRAVLRRKAAQERMDSSRAQEHRRSRSRPPRPPVTTGPARSKADAGETPVRRSDVRRKVRPMRPGDPTSERLQLLERRVFRNDKLGPGAKLVLASAILDGPKAIRRAGRQRGRP